MQNTSQIDIIRFEKYMKPSGCCQACLSQAQINKDCIITCEICRSCIHQTHYGSQLAQPPEVWQCQRCRYFLQNGPSDIHCQFCPNLRGIMKQYTFQTRRIWLHPECAVWGFPIIFFVSNRKEGIRKQKPKSQSTYFWVRDYQSNENPCQVCKDSSGFLIKCKYYSCPKSYHVTCARPEGIVRDLQSMKIQVNGGYFPVYCKQHIELKIEDAKKRVKILKQKGEIEKATHFHKVANLFTIQLKNLQSAVKRCKLEQEMIKKMSLETKRNIHGNQNVCLNQLEDSFSSQHSLEFLKILQEQMVDQQLPLKPLDQIKIWKAQPVRQPIMPAPKPSQHKVVKLNRPIHHHGRHQKHKQIKQLSQVIHRQQMQIQAAVSLPPQPTQSIPEAKSSSQPSVGEHKVNNYQIMFDDF